MDPSRRDTDTSHLHPVYRAKAQQVLDQLKAENLPFQLFEGMRSPLRQLHLYSQHPAVTHARPWQSYHQYGVAGDFVLNINGVWSWDTSGQRGHWWARLQQIGISFGLEPLSFEKPHLQLAGLSWQGLHAGRYPAGGDEAWARALEESIVAWNGKSPSAPPVPLESQPRPPLEVQNGSV